MTRTRPRTNLGDMIAAIVLAAGEGVRFGGCKQLSPVGDKPMLQHVLDSVRASRVDRTFVVLGAYADEIRARIPFDGETVVINPDYANGTSTSIHAGLRALPPDADAALFVLGDQPFVLPRTLDTVSRSRSPIAIPTFDGRRGNPVLVSRALFPEMMEIRGDVGCRAIFGTHANDITLVPVDDAGILTDVDTPPGESL